MKNLASCLQNAFYSAFAPDKRGRQWLLPWLFIAAAIFSLGVFIYGFAVWTKDSQIGTLGDFIGGTLNPILTFLTFMGLLLTIVLQQQELRDTRTELAKSAKALDGQIDSLDRQNFEATFFEMLHLYNTIVSSVAQREGNTLFQGRELISRAYDVFKGQYGLQAANDDAKLQASYNHFSASFQPALAHYYRYLFNMIRFIRESDVDHGRYMRLVRAQLSDRELALLFYTSLFSPGDRFRKYIEEFSLFDDLPTGLLFAPEHRARYAETAFSD